MTDNPDEILSDEEEAVIDKIVEVEDHLKELRDQETYIKAELLRQRQQQGLLDNADDVKGMYHKIGAGYYVKKSEAEVSEEIDDTIEHHEGWLDRTQQVISAMEGEKEELKEELEEVLQD